MLRFMRENTGSWIIKIILGLIVLVFIFLGMGSVGSNRSNQVAMVNDIPITMDEYRQSYQNTIEQMRQRFGNNLNDELLKMLQVKKQAMDRLIEDRLIAGEADRLDIKVSDKELQKSLVDVEAFKKNGVFDTATYRMVLSRNRLTPESFETMQRQALRQAKVRDLILKSVKVSDIEAGEWYRQNNGEVAVNYVKFDPASYSVTADDAKIAEYHEKNKDKYKSEPELKVQYLKYAFDDYKDKVEISQEDIELYYGENPDRFTTPEQVEASHILIKVAADADEATVESARKEAEEVYKKAEAGEDFAELAKEFSQGPTKDKGGYLGKFARNSMVKPFADKAFSMKPDEISEPVKTQFGWHVIKVQSKTDETKKSLEKATDEIKKSLLDDQIKTVAYNAAAKAFDAVIDGDSLEQAGLLTSRKLQEAGPFTMKGPEGDFKDGNLFARTAFELPINDISDVKEIGRAYYVIKPVEKIEAAVLDLNAARERVKKDLIAQLQQEEAKKAAEAFLTAIADVEKIKDVAKEKGVELKTTPLFKKYDNIADLGREPEVAAAAFNLSEKKKLTSEVIKGSGGYYVIALKDKKVPLDEEIQKNMKSVKERLAQTKQGQIYASWIEKLRSNSAIVIEPGVIDG